MFSLSFVLIVAGLMFGGATTLIGFGGLLGAAGLLGAFVISVLRNTSALAVAEPR